MEMYIKANPKVAKFLHLDTIRNAVKDGNYLLWVMDIQQFGSLADMQGILQQIGAISLTGEEARQEQDGTVTRKLPVATDKRFVLDAETKDSSSESSTEQNTGSGSQNNGDSASGEAGSTSGGANSESGETGSDGQSDGESASSDSDSDLKKEGGKNE